MEPERSHLSITLPRNFQFHYEETPRTPEPTMPSEDSQPPPPPRPILKVRRRRTTAVSINPDFLEATGACPIPTIEAPELYSEESSVELPALPDALNNDYLSPAPSFTRMLSPPKTPVSQMRSLSDCQDVQDWSDMNHVDRNESWSRPTSSSGFSDSSLSSRGSFDFSVSGSCTSPEEEMVDPFPYYSEEKFRLQNSSPLASQGSSVPKMKIRVRTTFNDDMDHHLWMTYMKYLQDPTITPFKALPSTVPPNGVCHRVARMARKTWKGPRSSSLFVTRAGSRYASRCGTPDTVKPAKSGSCTPVPSASKPYSRFPTEKQCRKRLRELAKQKPSLSAHYQRLLRRSPSPLQSSPPPEARPEPEPTQPSKLSSPFCQGTSSFSTRDMNISLATSTATSMQMGNPLTRLTTGPSPRPEHDWASARASAHQKSQSLHIGLGLSNMLGSSFARMSEMTDSSMHQHNPKTWHAPSGVPPRLGSPLQLHSPRPIARPFRRRALRDFEEQVRNRSNSFVDEVFGAPAESSHRRVRSRGFSLGDMMAGARRLPKSTNGPPPAFNPFANMAEVMPTTQQPSAEAQLSAGQSITRLGSPFIAKPSNTFPRASTSYGFEPAASFEQRFAEYRASPDRSRC